ncbi:MAG: hypothetical protein OMM_10693 [Candidatus Magnetoglobus multicellularis str. Araruama]|uniref:Uncharacterized protein n=1 Tax=Candidatus Magnetoglobus multicellularis str. Araruama TaxID=890399 RepID=A0A1V1P0J3_9BACT|nr:MAG: hypothetical protein OMM_10693 [Candidatus Magnetoglobus multicellularis str. Araruama]
MESAFFTKTAYPVRILAQLLIFFATSYTTVFAIDIGIVAPLNTEYGKAMISGIDLYYRSTMVFHGMFIATSFPRFAWGMYLGHLKISSHSFLSPDRGEIFVDWGVSPRSLTIHFLKPR